MQQTRIICDRCEVEISIVYPLQEEENQGPFVPRYRTPRVPRSLTATPVQLEPVPCDFCDKCQTEFQKFMEEE